MAKRKKHRRKSTKCPEPFNSLIGIAGAMTLGAIADKRRKKYGYNKSGIDPYAASGFAIGTGMVDNTEDLINLGGFLGAMGAFDDGIEEPQFSELDNRYAWRLNCQNGDEYGIYPEDFETREEYNEAIENAQSICCDNYDLEDSYDNFSDEFGINTSQISNEPFVVCRVSLLSNGKNIYCLPNDEQLKVGDRVTVLLDDNSKESGIIISIEQTTDNLIRSDSLKARIYIKE